MLFFVNNSSVIANPLPPQYCELAYYFLHFTLLMGIIIKGLYIEKTHNKLSNHVCLLFEDFPQELVG